MSSLLKRSDSLTDLFVFNYHELFHCFVIFMKTLWEENPRWAGRMAQHQLRTLIALAEGSGFGSQQPHGGSRTSVAASSGIRHTYVAQMNMQAKHSIYIF